MPIQRTVCTRKTHHAADENDLGIVAAVVIASLTRVPNRRIAPPLTRTWIPVSNSQKCTLNGIVLCSAGFQKSESSGHIKAQAVHRRQCPVTIQVFCEGDRPRHTSDLQLQQSPSQLAGRIVSLPIFDYKVERPRKRMDTIIHECEVLVPGVCDAKLLESFKRLHKTRHARGSARLLGAGDCFHACALFACATARARARDTHTHTHTLSLSLTRVRPASQYLA